MSEWSQVLKRTLRVLARPADVDPFRRARVRQIRRLCQAGSMGVRTGFRSSVVVAVGAISLLAACTGSPSPSATSSIGSGSSAQLSLAGDPVPQMHPPVELGPQGGRVEHAGVVVEVLPGAVPDGAHFRVSSADPIGKVTRGAVSENFGPPVQVEHPTEIGKPIHLEWDVSGLTAEQRSSLVLVRWDPELGVWNSATERVVLNGLVLSVDVTKFSIVDWVSDGAASISQTVGQWSGKRSEAPSCSGSPLPAWVTNTVRPDADQPAMPIRTCTEPDKNGVLTVRVANNRPYTQALDLVQGRRYAWTWAGEQDLTVAGIIRDTVNGLMSDEKSLIIAPTRAAAVGLARPQEPGTARLTIRARTTVATVAEDILVYLLANVVGLDSVGGFDSEAINHFAQTIYDCGGKQVLKSREVVGADAFQKILETVKSCAESDTVAAAIEQVARAQIAKGGRVAQSAIQTNRLLKEVLGKLGLYLTVVDFASYTAEMSSSAAIGDVEINVFGTGTPQALGTWKASCVNVATDSASLYKNLALQDAFSNKGKELWQFPTWKASSVKAVKPLAACSPAHIESVAGDVEDTWADKKASAIVAASIRALGGNTTSSTDVTPTDLLTAMVPEDCDNVPAQRLVRGKAKGEPGEGWLNSPHLAVDLAGIGYKQQLASYGCTAGGVGWPEVLILIGRSGQLLASYDLGMIGKQEHATVYAIKAADNAAVVSWRSYEGAGYDIHSYRSRVSLTDGNLHLTTRRTG